MYLNCGHNQWPGCVQEIAMDIDDVEERLNAMQVLHRQLREDRSTCR